LSAELLRQLALAEGAGLGEAVLTGVNIGQYREDGTGDLSALIKLLLSQTTRIALRLSSLEPDVFDDEFFALAEHPRLRPHFHLSIQSGSAEILQKMGRFYKPDDNLGMIQRLRAVKDDPFLAADIICGFPGEMQAHFDETLAFCAAADFAQIHVFPYSRRPGTAAWDFKPLIPERETEKRVKILQKLARSGRKAYIERWLGRETGGVYLPEEGEEYMRLLTDNYLKVNVRAVRQTADLPQKGQQIRCKICRPAAEDEKNDDAWGEIAEDRFN
jgi:threonylcarbamoyladenosine tRNA methylthiotransferase MtaB